MDSIHTQRKICEHLPHVTKANGGQTGHFLTESNITPKHCR